MRRFRSIAGGERAPSQLRGCARGHHGEEERSCFLRGGGTRYVSRSRARTAHTPYHNRLGTGSEQPRPSPGPDHTVETDRIRDYAGRIRKSQAHPPTSTRGLPPFALQSPGRGCPALPMSPLSRGLVLLLLHTWSQQVMQGKLGLGSAHGSMVSLSWVRFAMSCSKLRTRFLLAKRTACKSSVARSQTRLAMADRVARCALLETATPKATLHHACARKPQTRNDAKMAVTRWRELVLNTTELPQFWSWP